MEPRTFSARCPYCSTPYENIDMALAGRKARCVRCKRNFILEYAGNVECARSTDNVHSPAQRNESGINSQGDVDRANPINQPLTDSAAPNQDADLLEGEPDTPTLEHNASSETSGTRSSFSDFDDEFQNFSLKDFARQYPDPLPKGVWRPGEILLDGLCQVLPLAHDKLYAEGGVGYVQRVRRKDWNIDLIIKSPKPGSVKTETGKENFERECQTWIELGLHSNIVSCYFVRRIDGVPRLFAELAPDGTLRDWIADKRLYSGTSQEALAKLLDVAIQFAWGLEHAHSQGLLHLDVKPGNVMVSGSTIKVTDFGLSKFASEASDSQSSFEGMTPSYCSPEQFNAYRLYRKRREEGAVDANAEKSVIITKQSDIWSWAISILSMFHGRSPCKQGGQTAAEVFEIFLKHQNGAERPLMPASLVELLRRCFQKDPNNRPESMQLVADELIGIYEEEIHSPYPRRQPHNAALTAESFSNRAISLLDLGKTQEAISLLRKATRREHNHPLISFNKALALWRAGYYRDVDATGEMEELVQNCAKDPTALYVLGLMNFERGNLKASVNAFEGALDLAPKRSDVRRSLNEALRLLPLDSQCLIQYVLKKATENEPPVLYVSEDSEYILLELINDKHVLLNAYNGAPLITFIPSQLPETRSSHSSRPVKIAVSDDYRWSLARIDKRSLLVEAASFKGEQGQNVKLTLHIVDWHECKTRSVRYKKTRAKTINGKKETKVESFVVNFEPREHGVFVSENGVVKHNLVDETQSITALAITNDGEWLATGSDDSQICVWNVQEQRCVRTFQGLGGAVEAIWFDSQRRYVVAVTKGNFFQFFSVKLICSHSNEIHAPHLLCLINSSEELIERQSVFEKLLAKAVDSDHRGDIATAVEAYYEAQRTEGWESFQERFEDVLDRRAMRSRLRGVTQKLLLHAHEGVVSAIQTAWNGAFLATAGKDSTIRLWARDPDGAKNSQAPDWTLKYELDAHFDWIRTLALSPDNRFLASSSWDQRVLLWDLASGKRIRAIPETVKSPTQTVFAPDGRTLALATANGAVSLWDMAQTRNLLRIHAGQGEVHSLTFSRDGRFFVTATDDGYVRLWNGQSSLPLRELGPFPASVLATDLSCDSKLLVAGCANGKIYTLDLTTNRETVLSGHLGEVGTVNLFPDANLLASTGKDKIIRIWNVSEQKEIQKISNPDGEITSFDIDIVGARIFIGSDNGNVRGWKLLWDYQTPPINAFNNRARAIVSTLAGYYLTNEFIHKNQLEPRDYFGVGVTPLPDRFANESPITSELVAKIALECSIRGLQNLTRTKLESVIRALCSEKARFTDF